MAQTNVLVIEKNDFKQLAKEFPDMIDRVQRNLTTALRDSFSPLLFEIEKLQVKSQKQIATVADMFFAAQRGEVETVRDVQGEEFGMVPCQNGTHKYEKATP